jgi:hypothetical protein
MLLPSASASSIEVHEVTPLSVKSGQEVAFERAFAEAQVIISGMPGYLGHELGRCLESPAPNCFSCAGNRLKPTSRASGIRNSIWIGSAFCNTSTILFRQSFTTGLSSVLPNPSLNRTCNSVRRPGPISLGPGRRPLAPAG